MKKLLNSYGFTTDTQYFEMISASFLNGQKSQAWEQFRAMPKASRVEMLKTVTLDGEIFVAEQNVRALFDLILK